MTDKTEKQLLQERLTKMNVPFSPNAGVETLKKKLNAALAGETDAEAVKDSVAPAKKGETEGQRRARLRREASQLVRVRIQCMNPNKKEWEGEIFTVGNKFIGTFRKFVPFGVEWHVPKVIFNMIKARKCQVFVTKPGKNGIKVRKGKLIPEFAIEELAPLTEKELAELRAQQAAAGGVSDE